MWGSREGIPSSAKPGAAPGGTCCPPLPGKEEPCERSTCRSWKALLKHLAVLTPVAPQSGVPSLAQGTPHADPAPVLQISVLFPSSLCCNVTVQQALGTPLPVVLVALVNSTA